MAGINFIGSYSGIDSSTIEKLMQAEKMPLVQMSGKKTSLTEKQNAWRDINTRLNSLYEKIKTFQNQDTFVSKKTSTSNEKIVTMSASKNAVEGNYKINVKQLATSSSIIGNDIPAGSLNELGEFKDTGYFLIGNNDGVEHKIEISSGDSLKSLVEKINNVAKDRKDPEDNDKTIKGTGINATIIDNKLVLTDIKTGERVISLTDDGNQTLGKLGLVEGTKNNGKSAIFTINNVEITRSSNTISNAIDGITINLHKEHGKDEYDTVTIAVDTEKASKAIQDFVDQYNSTMKFLEDKLAAGTPDVPGSKGILAGDSTLMRLHSSLRNMVTSTIDKGGEHSRGNISDMSQLGVSTIDKFGQLKFDSSKLTDALKNNPKAVIDFFSSKDSNNNDVGFAPRLKDYVDSFIASDKGIIKGKTEGLEKTLKDLNKQIENFNARMERKEKQYIKMFTALDVAMMKSEDQMNWLMGQVDAMNTSSSFRRK